jgi:hypothetical protein
MSRMTVTRSAIALVALSLACSTSYFPGPGEDCGKPGTPMCRQRLAAWCTGYAMSIGAYGGAGGGVMPLACGLDGGPPANYWSPLDGDVSVFADAGALDDAGFPVACPSSSTAASGDTCCTPTTISCE